MLDPHLNPPTFVRVPLAGHADAFSGALGQLWFCPICEHADDPWQLDVQAAVVAEIPGLSLMRMVEDELAAHFATVHKLITLYDARVKGAHW